MIYFENRETAGKALGKVLSSMSPSLPVVLGVAAGGIEVAKQCALELKVPLDTIVSKKLYYPVEPESVMGAVSEDGSYYFSENARVNYAAKTLEKELRLAKHELDARVALFRAKREFPNLEGRTVIVVDEGILTPASVMPLLETCRKKGAAAVWLASPMAGEGTCLWLAEHVDELVILKRPKMWYRIEDGYGDYRKLPRTALLEMLG